MNIHTSPARIRKLQLEAAGRLYQEMEGSPYPADRLLGNFFHRNRKRFGSKDRKVISEAVYGMFRHKRLIEVWLRERRAWPLAALACEGLVDKETFVALSGLKNGRLLFKAFKDKRLPSTKGDLSLGEKLSLQYSFPLWMIERWVRRFGREEAERLIQSMNERPPLILRANPVKISREALVNRFCEKGYDARPAVASSWGVMIRERFNVFEMSEFKQGLFEVQDVGSQKVVLLLDPKPSEVVWDVCAGGGGKTLFIAGLMRNKGRVIATDIRAKKLDDLRARAKRAGIFNIFPADLARLKESKIIRRGVDRLLMDVPCSGTGTLRRNPDAKWKIFPEKLFEFQTNQIRILESYAPYLKPGGTLVYSTCSMEPEENEQVIEIFLKNHPEFTRRTPDVHLYPHTNGTDGFFISSLYLGDGLLRSACRSGSF